MRSLLIQFWHSNQEVTEAKSEGKSTKEQKNDCILIKKLWCFHFELPLYSDSHSGDAHVTAMFGQPWPKYEPAGLLAYINIKLRTFQLVMTKLKWQNTLIWTPGRAADYKCACAHLNPAFLQQTCCKLGICKFFSPMWMHMCKFKHDFCAKGLLQVGHVKVFLQCESVPSPGGFRWA